MLLAAASTVVLVALAAVWFGSRRQQNHIRAQTARLTQAAVSTPPAIDADLDSLPAPVGRYLRWSLGQVRSIRLVRISQVGTLRADTGSDRWMSFEAEHLVAPAATSFVWNARVAAAPLLHLRVRDAFVEGKGSGHVSLLSAFPVSADAGTPQMNSGSLHRFLAEAVWYPTALLPGAGLEWRPIDDRRALATLIHQGISVALEFRFGETGEVTGIYTPGRWGTFGGGYEQRPWEGHFRNYTPMDGVWVPRTGDVGWYVDGEWRRVWEGTVVGFQIDERRP